MRGQKQPPEIKKKYNAGTNKQSQMIQNVGKLIETDDPIEVKRVEHTVASTIQKKRAELGLSQKQLAEKICVKQTIIADFESGGAVIDHAILTKLERALKVRLRGAHIGEPLTHSSSNNKTSKTKINSK